MEIKSKTINNIYLKIASELIEDGERVAGTHELNNVKLELTDITNNIVSVRDISPAYLFGELLWYLNGDNSLEFISKFSSFWNHLSDDGKTCNSAYGYLIQKKHGFNQIDKVVELLKTDPESRRAKININIPNEHVIETKDEPCTMSLHFMIRDGRLNCTAVMRSNDIWFGFPYDVAFFTEVQKMIAERLHVGWGTYTHFAVSLHVYDRDLDKLKKIIRTRSFGDDEPIRFNRGKFFDHSKEIFDIMASYTGDQPKEKLLQILDHYGIYRENKTEERN